MQYRQQQPEGMSTPHTSAHDHLDGEVELAVESRFVEMSEGGAEREAGRNIGGEAAESVA